MLATLWARTRIDTLAYDPDARGEITKLGLDYRLMTAYTSFVAVEETVVTDGGKPRRVDVPVEMPEGVSYEGVFGKEGDSASVVAVGPRAFAGGVVGGVAASRQMVTLAAPSMKAEGSREARDQALKLDPTLLQTDRESDG